MKRRTKFLVALAALFLGIAFIPLFGPGHAVAEDSFARIDDGMTEAQVRDLLGVPQRVRHDTPETTAFCYGGFRRFEWCSMEVYFGAAGRVTNKFHDH